MTCACGKPIGVGTCWICGECLTRMVELHMTWDDYRRSMGLPPMNPKGQRNPGAERSPPRR